MIEQSIRIGAAAGSENFPTLNDRQKQILKEVCESFISTGVPVGSRTISRFGGLACSPATIRNEMADLESLGYLFAPHTSAGRVPTEMGYRFYVNSLIEYGRLCQIEENLVIRLIEKFENERAHQKAVLQSAVRFASEVTHLTGVLLTPQKASRKLRSIQLIRLLEDQVMLITIDDCGRIAEQVFGIPADTSDASLNDLARVLNTEICNREVHDSQDRMLREMQQLLARHNLLLKTFLDQLQISILNPQADGVFLEGLVNFFEQTEFQDPVKIRRMICLLERKDYLLNVLGQSLENGDDVMVNIGSSSGLGEEGLSMVTARYQGPNQSFGRIGLIGPTRMDYGRVVATLVNISKALTELFLGKDSAANASRKRI